MAGKVAGDLIPAMSKAAFDLLLIPGQQAEFGEWTAGAGQPDTGSSVLLVDCARDGCWEADIILLGASPQLEETVLRLKDVATQKIVLLISAADQAPSHYQAIKKLQQWLPYSKIVSALYDKSSSSIQICGEDPGAVEDITTVFTAAGLKHPTAMVPCGDSLSSSPI